MAFTKITQQELNSRGATTLPNQPTIPAQQLKQEFDAPAKEIVAPKVNNLIDELEATSAAANIGAVAPTGRSGDTVKEVLDDMSEDLSAVEGTSHSHSNKSLLDSYNQTNSDLSDAVSKKHSHSNKSVLDKFTESGGKPLYDGQTIGEGDMKKSDYDSDSTVKNAGGIKAYVDARASAAYRPSGTKTVAELLPALLIEENNNNVYNITDSGLTTEYFLEGAGKPIYPGDNVGIAYVSPNTYKFDLLRGIVDLTPYAKTADLGTAAYKDSTNAVTQASTDLVESGAVYASVNAVAQDLSDANLAITALQTSVTNLGKYKAEADSIAPVELDATGASQAYAVDDQFYLIDILLTATSPIAQNDAIVVYPTAGYNCKPSDSVTEQIGQINDTIGFSSDNLFDRSTCTEGYIINESGTVVATSGFMYSDLIPVQTGDYGFSDTESANYSHNIRIHAYNSSGTWLRQLVSYSVISGNYTIPFSVDSDVAYIRVSLKSDASNIVVKHLTVNQLISNKAETSVISEYVEDGATCANPNGYAMGEHFQKNGKFCTAITSIAYGATLTLNTNYVEGDVASVVEAVISQLGKLSYKMFNLGSDGGMINTNIKTNNQFMAIVIYMNQDTVSLITCGRRHPTGTFYSSDAAHVSIDSNNNLTILGTGASPRYHIIYAQN